MPQNDFEKPLVSVVLPCLNEEEAIGACIAKIESVFKNANVDGEIVVSDNGSTDRSVEIAESMGVRVVHQPLRGYGNAYHKGFAEARGKYLVMGDADDTYDFNLIPQFLEKLVDQKYDFVTGSRYAEGGDENITFLHRWVGNPALTMILNVLFGCKYTDVYCGFRAFSREAYDRISPISPGMEFNLELAINAQLANLRIAEIPIKLAPRKGESKLNTFRDGWRSLRMMLLYSPNKVFLIPGLTLFVAGILVQGAVVLNLITHEVRNLGSISGIFATVLTVVGFQILSLGLHTKTYSWSRRFDKDNESLLLFYKYANLETGLLIGALMVLTGMAIAAWLITGWLKNNLLPLPNPEWAPVSATLIIIGVNVVFTALFISAMSMRRTDGR